MNNAFQQLTDSISQTRFPASRMSRRTFMQVAVGAFGAAALASCGSTSGSGSSGITLTQWYHQYGEAGTQQATFRYASQYHTVNPNVTVKVGWIPGDYTGTKLPAALLSPTGPDIFELPIPLVSMIKAGQIIALDDLYTPEVKNDFISVNLNSLTINGHLYGVQEIDGTGMIYYRKSMLNAAGVQPPTTMDELIAAAKALTRNNVKGLFIGNDGGINAMEYVLPWSAGTDFLVNNAIIFDNARTVLAYEKLRELNRVNALLLGAPTDWSDPSAFIQGLTAMQWTGMWAMPAITRAIGDDYGVIPWPALDAQGTPATFWSGWAAMVNGHSKHIDEAKAFVKWLWINNVKDQQDWNLDYGFHIPPRKSVATVASKLKTGPAAQAVQYANQYGHTNSPFWDNAMSSALTTALSNIVKNGADAATVVHTAAQQCKTELTKLLS